LLQATHVKVHSQHVSQSPARSITKTIINNDTSNKLTKYVLEVHYLSTVLVCGNMASLYHPTCAWYYKYQKALCYKGCMVEVQQRHWLPGSGVLQCCKEEVVILLCMLYGTQDWLHQCGGVPCTHKGNWRFSRRDVHYQWQPCSHM
jgi:hypothetical protein